MLFFKSLGIPTPEIVGFGQNKQYGVFKRGAIITKEIKNSIDLARLSQKNPKQIQDKKWIEYVGVKYTKHVRRLHDNKFIHADLKWRNILVTNKGTPEIFFIDCPSGKKMCEPFFSHWRIKDLACLDKIARLHLTPATRLKFFKTYLKTDELSYKDKKLLKKVREFFPFPCVSQERSVARDFKSWQYTSHENPKTYI